MKVTIDFAKIVDWESFHKEFANVMGFPNFYGNNMDAWIDCMTDIDNPETGMTKVSVSKGQSLDLIVSNIEKTSGIRSDIVSALVECSAAVNQRFIESGSTTRIRLIAT